VVQSAAALAGLTIHHERMAVFPNTWKAHRLLAAAAQQLPPLVLESLVDALFETYFVQGLDLSDREVLATLAQSHGVDMRDADCLDMPAIWHLPPGAFGVPLFVINGQHILSGAQAPDVLLAALLDTSSPNKSSA
jgi:predicted DsbA family dithiol-disulfide isomerase